jgi:peptidoglycan/LPS O-acetylase OafA/YrhL
MQTVQFPAKNNFDILRFLAAFQVAVFHGYSHFKLGGQSVVFDFLVHKILIYFPGVPIFFAMSGFLIFSSYDRRRDLRVYCKNRFLRLYPGLWFSFLFTMMILFSFRFITLENFVNYKIIAWIIGNVTFVQFYTPDILRGYGLGNPNGSLWTIVVELQYYAFVPILYYLFKKISLSKNIILLILVFLSILANVFMAPLIESESFLGKLASVSLTPYLFYFLLGALVYVNYQNLSKYIEGKSAFAGLVYFLFYISASQFGNLFYPGYWPNIFGLINTFLLIWFIFTMAFSATGLSHKILKGNDLSYGLYVYHGIVLNLFIHKQVPYIFAIFWIYLLISLLLALFSWKLIEQPALKLKGLKKQYKFV